MGDSYEGAESMSSVIQAMRDYMPGAIQAITAVQPEVARTQAAIDAEVSPLYAETQNKLYDTYGRELNQIGSEIETANQLAASEREKAIADTYGSDLVSSADKFQRMIDPEFYEGKAAVGKGITDLLESMDPTQLSGSERAEVERAVNRSGAVNPNNAAATAANAMTFGRALQDKQAAFGQALTAAAGSLPSTRAGFTGFEVATRRALTPNTGDTKFTGVQANTGQNAWNTGNQFMQQASQLQGIKNQKSKDLLDQIQQGAQSFNSAVQAFNFS